MHASKRLKPEAILPWTIPLLGEGISANGAFFPGPCTMG